MWPFLTTLLSALIGLFAKSKPNPVAAANRMNVQSAEVARQTETQTEKDLANVQTETDKSVADVRSAGSLLDAQRAVQAAIDRANKQPGADS